MSVQRSQQAKTITNNQLLALWAPVVTYCLLIFTVSSQQDLSPPEFPSSDKIAHVLEYGVLGLLWSRAAKRSCPHWTFRMVLLSTTLFTGLYGATDEWHQLYVPGRFSDWRDAVADVCGGTIGGMLYLGGSRFLAKRATVSPTPAV